MKDPLFNKSSGQVTRSILDLGSAPWAGRFSPTALLLATIVLLATRDFLLGALAPALRAAWPSVKLGWWVFRLDSNRPRSKTCFVFYLAVATMIAAVVAFGLLFFLVLLSIPFPEVSRVIGESKQVKELIFTLLGGMGMSCILTVAGICMAFLYDVRVWAGALPNIHDEHTATDPNERSLLDNPATFAVGSLFFYLILLLALVMGDAGWHEITMFIPLLGGPISMLIFFEKFAPIILARHPLDCWGNRSGSN